VLLFRNPSLENKRVASAAFPPCQAKGVGVAFGLPRCFAEDWGHRFLFHEILVPHGFCVRWAIS
jgi:hypothetical protein